MSPTSEPLSYNGSSRPGVDKDRAPDVQLHHHELAGKPLTSYRVIVELVTGTTNETGLRILAEWDQGAYPTGTEIKDAELAALSLNGHEWHSEWNYDLTPAVR